MLLQEGVARTVIPSVISVRFRLVALGRTGAGNLASPIRWATDSVSGELGRGSNRSTVDDTLSAHPSQWYHWDRIITEFGFTDVGQRVCVAACSVKMFYVSMYKLFSFIS